MDISSEQLKKLIKNDFFWDVRVVQASNVGDTNKLFFSLTLNTIDDYGRRSRIMIEMTREDLDKFIAELKRKV